MFNAFFANIFFYEFKDRTETPVNAGAPIRAAFTPYLAR